MIKDLLLHILIIVLPFCLYQMIHLDVSSISDSKKAQWTIGLASGVSSLLCMLYPMAVDSFRWDLRYVPIFTAIVYGGPATGIIALAVALLGRFLLPLDPLPLYIVTVVHIVYTLPAFLLARRFPALSLLRKWLVSMALATLAFAIVFGTLWLYWDVNRHNYLLNEHGIAAYGSIYALEVLAVTLSVLLMETCISNAKMRHEVQRYEKLTLVSQLAASVAHEVRNPLTVVRGFLQLMKGAPIDSKSDAYITTAIAELDRAEFIISDYLDLAKPEIDQIETIAVCDKMSKVGALMSSYASMHGIELQMTCESGLFFYGDRVKFKQVMVNVIKNAIEATHAAGSSVQVAAYKERECVVFTVTDSGRGMSKEELRRLGTPFYSTKTKGTGIGVMVTMRIVEAMKGAIRYESEVGKGTSVFIYMPLAK